MQTQLFVFILRRTSPSLESNCTCWTSEQPYQIIPKLKLGPAVNIVSGEKDIKNHHTQIVNIQNGASLNRDFDLKGTLLQKITYKRLNRTNPSKAPWFSWAPLGNSSSFALVFTFPQVLCCSSVAWKAVSRKSSTCWPRFSAQWAGRCRHNNNRGESAQNPLQELSKPHTAR